jgi:signal transduction histidine kinase
VSDRTDNQPPLDRRGVALRYLCAVLPMLFYSVVLTVVVSRDRSRFSLALIDVALGMTGLMLMRWRRRWPWQIALATALLTVFSTTATGPAQVAYVSLATHRRWRQLVPVAFVSWLCLAAYATWRGLSQASLVSVVTSTAVLGGLTLFALYLRGRRDLATSERAAIVAAERAQLHRIEQAKLAERVRIAHEMHDVLAHRISLLSMLAGGLAYRTDLTADESREIALAIQDNAHQSLNELRSVLRTLSRDEEPAAPQPNLAHLDALFEEVRAAGQQVEVEDTIACRELLPTQTGRHAYRIVQEAMTNARKHAPGTPVTAELGGRPGDGLRIRVSNPAPVGGSAGPGARLGLVGLGERTRMAGGELDHAVRHGRFVLDARLPWDPAYCDSNGDRG